MAVKLITFAPRDPKALELRFIKVTKTPKSHLQQRKLDCRDILITWNDCQRSPVTGSLTKRDKDRIQFDYLSTKLVNQYFHMYRGIRHTWQTKSGSAFREINTDHKHLRCASELWRAGAKYKVICYNWWPDTDRYQDNRGICKETLPCTKMSKVT